MLLYLKNCKEFYCEKYYLSQDLNFFAFPSERLINLITEICDIIYHILSRKGKKV